MVMLLADEDGTGLQPTALYFNASSPAVLYGLQGQGGAQFRGNSGLLHIQPERQRVCGFEALGAHYGNTMVESGVWFGDRLDRLDKEEAAS